jgi:ankyrin repeat protein
MTNRKRILLAGIVLLVVAIVSLGRSCILVRIADAGWRLPVTAALNLGAPVNTSCNGRSLLHAAVVSGNLRLVQLLISRGANINHRNRLGSTALMGAAAAGDNEMITMLLSAGADVSARRTPYESILLAPVHNGHLETVHLLLKAGADCRFDSAALLAEAVRQKQFQILKLLLETGADPNARGTRDSTALMWAAAFDNLSYVRLLLAHGADPSARDVDGKTANDWAMREGRDVTQVLGASSARPPATRRP